MPVTIVFRGLMVLLQPRTGGMQVGVLRAPGHFPRILTMENGVVAGLFDLRRRPELDRVRDWAIEVTNPSRAGVTLHTDGTPSPFDRLDPRHTDLRDFRWITDLEGPDLQNESVSAQIDRSRLRFVINMQNGEFATRLLSPSLERQNPDASKIPFGNIAAVTECVMSFGSGGRVRMTADGNEVFPFPERANTIYEFANTPPDIDPGHVHENPMVHFTMYYDHLFRAGQPPPNKRFDLVVPDATPAPDPALCGIGYMGQTTDPPF